MGHVHYKGDIARTFVASANPQDEEAAVDHEIARMARSMRPQLHIPKPVIWALLASIIGHSAVAIALSVAQVSDTPATTARVYQAPRTISLDWDLYAGGAASAAALVDEPSMEEPPAEEPVAVAAALPRHERSDRRTERKEETPTIQEEAPTEVPAAPVEALVDNGSATRVDIPTGEQTGPAQRVPTSAPSQDAQASSPAQAAGSASGSQRQAGATGNGEGIDLDGVRRGHIASLNRAIRRRNPCTRELSHRGLSGDVVVGLTQNRDGSIDEVRVLRSSGEALIDEAAKDFIRSQSRLPSPNSHLAGEVWQVGLRFQCGN